MMQPFKRAVLGLLMLAMPGAARAGDWLQFRGPGGAAVSDAGAAVPMQWNDSSHLRWKAMLPGPGSSSPIVVGERVFVTCYSGYGTGSDGGDPTKLKRQLVCVDRKAGKILWASVVDAGASEDSYRGFLTEHGYATSTPVSDGENVFVFFGKSGVLAFDLAGKRLWQTNVGSESDIRHWGSAASPILYKDLVIVNASSEGRAIVGLDKKSGKVVWKAEAAGLTLAFGTPALVKAPDGRQEVVVGVPGEVWGLNPDNGKLLWFAEVSLTGNVCPSVVAADGVVFVTGGFESHGTVAIRTGGKDDVSKSHVVWTSRESSYVPSPLVLGGKLYCVDDSGRAICMDAASGSVLHQERLSVGSRGRNKPVYASVVAVGENLIAVTRTAGAFVLKATPEMTKVGVNVLTDESGFNATPAVADGQLFLRSNRALYCIGN